MCQAASPLDEHCTAAGATHLVGGAGIQLPYAVVMLAVVAWGVDVWGYGLRLQLQ